MDRKTALSIGKTMTGRHLQALIFFSITLLLLTSALAAAGEYTETFTNTTHLNPGQTTAVWDTASGQLTMPVPPILIGSAATGGHAYAVKIWGDRAYVAAGTAGLEVFDITDPSAPFIIGSYDTPGEALDVAINGGIACVADGDSGLVILDVTDPTAPALSGRFQTGGRAQGVVCESVFQAWVASGTAG